MDDVSRSALALSILRRNPFDKEIHLYIKAVETELMELRELNGRRGLERKRWRHRMYMRAYRQGIRKRVPKDTANSHNASRAAG